MKGIIKGMEAAVLSAGKSSRMGRPKLFLRTGGRTFAEKSFMILRNSGFRAPFIVLTENENSDRLRDMGYRVVINRNPEKGQISSLQAVVSALPRKTEGLLVCLIDHPSVRLETVSSLLAAYRNGKYDAVIPEFRGKGGHPVIYSSSVFSKILSIEGYPGARKISSSGQYKVCRVGTSDPAVLQDIDTRGDFRELEDEG